MSELLVIGYVLLGVLFNALIFLALCGLGIGIGMLINWCWGKFSKLRKEKKKK